MPLMPKRVKFRKSQRGKVKGNATRGNTVSYGEYGLQSLEGGWLSAEAIEAGRITAAHAVRGVSTRSATPADHCTQHSVCGHDAPLDADACRYDHSCVDIHRHE